MGFLRYLFSRNGLKHLVRVLLVNAVLLLILWFGLGWYSDHGEYITVPDVRRLALADATEALRDRSLSVLVVDSIYDQKSQGGVVVEQSPAPESKVKQGRQVFLTIYRYQPPMERINIEEGEYGRVAFIKLQNKGIRYDVKYVPNNNMVGSVVSISHKGRPLRPGDQIRRGEKVLITIGQASEGIVNVPDLRGMDYNNAMALLDSLNLMGQGFFEPNAISTADSAIYRVCRQDPEFEVSGLPVRTGRLVDFWLSKEPCR